jgi:hypothetical protein
MAYNLGQQPALFMPLDHNVVRNGTFNNLYLYWMANQSQLSPNDKKVLLRRMAAVDKNLPTPPRRAVEATDGVVGN